MKITVAVGVWLGLTMGLTATAWSQDCVGGSIATKENYLYGRFEVRMQSVAWEGVVSSFFLYNIDEDCSWPEENNEIDIEMTGNNEWLQFTTHYPSLTYHTDIVVPDFNPHAALHDYAIEWEPGIVRWFVDGELANVQDAPYVEGLIHPMEILMNCWPSEAVGWTGVWDPSIMPVEAQYDYVRCYAYTPGTGSSGTDNNLPCCGKMTYLCSILPAGVWKQMVDLAVISVASNRVAWSFAMGTCSCRLKRIAPLQSRYRLRFP